MDASKYEPVMDTIYNIQIWNMKIVMEYNVKASILYLLCPRDFISQGRHFCHVAVFSFHVVMSCCPCHLDVIYGHVVLTFSHS